MDQAVVQALISAGAGLGGAAIGGGVAIHTARRQFERQQQAEREGYALSRSREAALTCDRLFAVLRDDIPDDMRASYESAEDRQRSARIQDAFGAIEHAVVDLPADLQVRVLEGLDYMRAASELGNDGRYGDFHWRSGAAICWRVEKEVHELLSAFLGYRELSPRSQSFEEFAVALEELRSLYEDFEAPDDAAYNARRRLWYEQHPQFPRPSD